MTSSIPLSRPETIVPSGSPAGPCAALPGDASSVPDFAGLLAGPAADSLPAPMPAEFAAPAVPLPSEDVLSAETPWVGIPAGVPVAPLLFASVARRFVPALGRVERAGDALAAPEDQTVDQPVAPTRAEQEEAMAMLSALFPVMPVQPVGFAPSPAPHVIAGGLPQPKEWVPAMAEAMSSASGISDVALPPARPVPGQERQTGWSEGPAPAPLARINRTEPTELSVPAAAARLGAPDVPAQPAVEVRQRDVMPLLESSSLVGWPEIAAAEPPRARLAAASPMPTNPAIETTHPRIQLAAGALLAPGNPEDASVVPGMPGAVAVAAPVPAEQPAQMRATPDFSCTVVEASVVRPDGVRLARRSAASSVGATRRTFVEEKSAGGGTANVAPSAREKNGAGKKVLSISEQQLAENMPGDGTTAANGRVTMNPISSLVSDAPAQRPGLESKLAAAVSLPSTAEAVGLGAPRVISTVLEVVEAQEASKLRPVPAVHLRMQVAGEMVGIKVELRDNTVQTHFTSMSPELREALTREWQAARTGTSGGAPRLLDPVFNANPDRGGSAADGQDAASQQQQQARAWGLPWQQSAPSPARRPRPPSTPESIPVAAPAADAHLFSAVA